MIRNVTIKECVEQYCEEVLSGDIVACKTTIQAVEKYKRELSQQLQPEFPFYFDEKAANAAIGFFPALIRHSIGEWAGQPFQLSPWQMFIVWNLFGWKRKDETRRFRRVFLSVARKNGKSTFCAGLAIMLGAADGEEGAQVFIGATKLDQAKIIFQESDRMLRQSPYISKHATILKDNISFSGTNSYIRPLGSDKPFDGLNPHAMFFDELHAWKEHHRGFFDTMTTGSGSRTQPIQVAITTAGDEKSTIYHEEADYARGVISGDIVDNTLFSMIFELDKEDDPFSDKFDDALLVKSNPGYGVSVKPEYLLQQLTEARNKPQAKNRFMRYHGNRCVSSVEDAITAEIWDACAGELSDWLRADGIGAGVDIGGRDDLAAYGLSAKFEIDKDSAIQWFLDNENKKNSHKSGFHRAALHPFIMDRKRTLGEKIDRFQQSGQKLYRYEAKSVAFIARDTKRDLTKEPFRTWIEQGKLIVCEYVVSTLKEYLIEDCQALGVEYVAYDPYQATQLAEELEQEGLKPVKMPQNHGHFNETIAAYLEEVSEGRFRPDENDVVLRWCALNMALNRNSQEKVMPDKKHSKEKIDAMVAYLMGRRACNLSLPRATGSLVL